MSIRPACSSAIRHGPVGRESSPDGDLLVRRGDDVDVRQQRLRRAASVIEVHRRQVARDTVQALREAGALPGVLP
jgi:hypothetical protein